MASQNITGNGSRLSLENCLTNIFALTDLAGIRWRRLRSQPGSKMDVMDDAVLASYARCLSADMLCAWARVSINDGTAAPTNFLEYAKELWIFWYGDEPTSLQPMLSTELQEIEVGSWETTLLSYECRTFLFKALHNVIERCLLAKSFLRIGKWFVLPQSDTDTEICSPLCFSFQKFFLHGESTVCVSVDIERKAPLYRLTAQQLKQARSSTTPTGATSGSCLTSVVLAPYGLAGRLTGGVVSPADQCLADWQQFYPIASAADSENADVPMMVEVAVGHVRMKYPSQFVLTTQAPQQDAEGAKPKRLDGKLCDDWLSEIVTKSTNDSLLNGKRADEDVLSWPFTESHGRTHCGCSKVKSFKQKQQQAKLTSKPEGRRQRTPFHRRSGPATKQLSVSGGGASGTGPVHTASTCPPTPSLPTVGGVNMAPAGTPQPSPMRNPRTPGSTLGGPGSNLPAPGSNLPAPGSNLPAPGSNMAADRLASQSPSVNRVKSIEEVKPEPRHIESHASLVKQEPGAYTSLPTDGRSVAATSLLSRDPRKRPSLPAAPVVDDELITDSLYRFSSLTSWFDLPLKRFRPGDQQAEGPQSYECLAHPLAVSATGPADSQLTATSYFVPGAVKREPPLTNGTTAGNSGPGTATASVTSPGTNLMTETALVPKMSDLDKMFDSEDEEHEGRLAAPSAPSGGNSMASAHANGPVPAADLCRIFPTPPSTDTHHQDADHLHPSESGSEHDPPDPPTNQQQAVYRAANVARYLAVTEYMPVELPSATLPTVAVSMPAECQYLPWMHNNSSNKMMGTSASASMPLNSVENLPLTVSNIHHNNSVLSPPFYGAVRTPLSVLPDMLQSPASVVSMPPKSVTGLLSVEGPSTHGASTFNSQSLPEAHSLLVNMSLTDSMLNLYKDQSFESCNICVCNMNILGNDLGLYLPREKFEAQFKCTCGFSAVTNRHYGYCSGLFYEDECEIMSQRDDRFDKLRLKPLVEKSIHTADPIILERILDQFSSFYTTILSRNVTYSNSVVSSNAKKISWELQDTLSVVLSALNTGLYMQDAMSLSSRTQISQCWSRWSLEKGQPDGLSHVEVIQQLRSLEPALQDAVQNKRTTSLWAPNAIRVTGPLTWSAFFKLAGRSTDELLEPQPIPPLIVGADEDLLRLSPFALQHWDKLMLKPFAGERNVCYVVVAPETDGVVKACRRFFTELSQMYEQCSLGRHTPYQHLRDGVLRVGRTLAPAINDKPISDWFKRIDALPHAAKLRLIAKICRHQLAPLLGQHGPDISSATPPSSQQTTGGAGSSQDNVFTKPQPRPSTPTATLLSPPAKDEGPKDILNDPRYKDARPKLRDNTDTSLTIYMVNPFSSGSGAADSSTGASEEASDALALLMCYQELLEALPPTLRSQTNLQLIPIQTLMTFTGDISDLQVVKNMAFSVYSQITKKVRFTCPSRTMTGFGPVSQQEPLKNLMTTLCTPPYILAPSRDLISTESPMDKSRVLLCAYCLSEDQRWLIASTIRDNGEYMDTKVINIHVPNYSRRRKATVIKHALHQLFDWLVTQLSKTVIQWRLVIGRFGRLGHGELKEWAKLLNRKSLTVSTKLLRENCDMCSSVPHDHPQVAILAACVISIEPHASFSLLFNDPKPDDKKNTACPLSTPHDASVTHILVIPNSTTAGGNQSHNEAPIDFAGDMTGGDSEGILQNIDITDDLDLRDIFGSFGTFADGFSNSPPHSPRASPTHNSSPLFGQPDGLHTRRGTVSSVVDLNSDEQVNLLQQPLAMGYIVSSAPTGRLPKWFFSAAPHAENSCPVIFKSALHFHTVVSQQNQDEYNQIGQQQMGGGKTSAHPLDSTTTCEVLRYVLDSYNRLSWLTMDPVSNDRSSCLPVHIKVLMQLYHALNTFL